jgi:ribosomal protein S17
MSGDKTHRTIKVRHAYVKPHTKYPRLTSSFLREGHTRRIKITNAYRRKRAAKKAAQEFDSRYGFD